MPETKKRQRAMPAANAFAFTIRDAQAMGAPGKSTIYEMIKDGRLTTIEVEGCPTMITGDSLRALLSGKDKSAS